MHHARCATLLALVLSAGTAAAQHPFTYSIPEGWTDLSPGAPASNFENLHPGIVHQAQSGRFVAFAMDLRSEDGFYEGMNALVRKGALDTDEDLNELIPELEHAYEQEFEAPVRIVEASHADVNDVQAIRVVYDVTLTQKKLRQVQYLMPGGLDWYTVVTYSTVPDQYDRYRGAFDSSASGTGGVAEARTGFSLAKLDERTPELASSVFLLTFLAFGVSRSFKKKTS